MRQNKPVSCPGVTSDVAFGIRSSILVCQDLSRDACAGVGYQAASLRGQELPRFLPDPKMIRRRPIQHAITHFVRNEAPVNRYESLFAYEFSTPARSAALSPRS
jgi:hypothetical protein